MIVLATDFGPAGPYVGQMIAAIRAHAPDVAVVDLVSDLPSFDAEGAAYLIAAWADAFPPASVFLCIVDPGVGSRRRALAVSAGERWFVGPDNGLLAIAARCAGGVRCWSLARPRGLAPTFHGRDLFAPVAARLALGQRPRGRALDPADLAGADWPDDLGRIVYVDSYGNAVTGLRAGVLGQRRLSANGVQLRRARTFSAVPEGRAFWYENANGLAEIAVNRGRADRTLGLAPGMAVHVL